MAGYIYKITNNINGKVYIGLTTLSVNERWKGHIGDSKRSTKPLYNSIRKYGIENFSVEEIDKSEDFEELGNLERYYIKKYNSTDRNFGYNITSGGERCQLDGNPRARLTEEDVKTIRKIYSENNKFVSDVWEEYKGKISYSAFEKIWEGVTWRSIMPEVYTSENIEWHRKHGKSMRKGEKNVNAIYSDKEVNEIRQYYVNHSLRECFEKYGKKSKSISAFRNVIDGSYFYLPIYKKSAKRWVYSEKGEEGKFRKNKENIFEIKGDSLFITVFDDYGKNEKTFVTDAIQYDIVKKYRWHIYKGGIASFRNNHLLTLKSLIINAKPFQKISHKDGNIYNVKRDNLI